MVRIRISFMIVLSLHVLHAGAQGDVRLGGVVLDSLTRAPLEGVHVALRGQERSVLTGREGRFTINTSAGKAVELELTFTGYAITRRWVTIAELSDPKDLVLTMRQQAIELAPAEVRRQAPQVVYQRTDLHVGDYFANDEGLWILTYERPQLWHREAEVGKQVLRDARLHLLDTNFVECCSVRLPGEVVRLHHDHGQRVVVEGMKEGWVAAFRKGEIVLQPIDLGTLEQAVLPWTDSIQGVLLGSTFSATYPAFDHIAYNAGTSETKAICGVEDKHLMDLFRSQYKYMSGRDKVIAMDLAIETGHDPEVIAGYMTEFYKDIYFDPPYAPLFVVHDTLCVFDHYKERIRRFRPDLSVVDEVPITHQNERAWRTRLLQDPTDGTVYAQFAKNLHTWLRSVDPSTGKLGDDRSLTHPFPEDVQVHNGHVYYVYRPYGSLQRRTLYREALR
ncbi:MAG TPA: carboxypeptidase-like regulatory domain-containing protein [Flavobacteriales bacterium]|nr:carboxypeptidase-like regulatory domain-containing protein [Flavobacteriales bacterium]